MLKLLLLTVTIFGQITTPTGRGVPDVTVHACDDGMGLTSPGGYYEVVTECSYMFIHAEYRDDVLSPEGYFIEGGDGVYTGFDFTDSGSACISCRNRLKFASDIRNALFKFPISPR